MNTYTTVEAWKKAYADRIETVSGTPAVVAMECAEAAVEAWQDHYGSFDGNGEPVPNVEAWPDPEADADEEMGYWTNDDESAKGS